MRFLLLLQWCLLFIPINSQGDCNWKLPTGKLPCTQVIKYKVHDDKQALATCLERFPTTFVDAKNDPNNNQITCTVHRQFQCNFMANPVSIFDKCYTFVATTETTMAEYLKAKKAGNSPCGKGGSLPVFLTMTQAKHIGMEAHRKGISKIWVNVNSEGNTIEKAEHMAEGTMLYKEPFKLYEGRYWNGEELKTTPIQNNKPEVPPAEKVNYLFFRSKTDHWNNLIQGSFERATADSKASIVCEYQAKIVPNQKKYCERMGSMGLGLNAMYSEKDKRCLYTTLSYFALEGTMAAIEHFPGCKETPATEQKAGLDDGTAIDLYGALSSNDHKGTYRLAAIKVDTTINNAGSRYYASDALQHCPQKPPTAAQNVAHRQAYETYNHFMDKHFAIDMSPDWEDSYPKDECTDFPTDGGKMNSNTLAVRHGKLRDVPVPVHFPAICSIQSNMDCQLYKHKITCSDGKLCKNVDEFDKITGYYAKCVCPKFHIEHGGECKFVGKVGSYNPDNTCAVMHKYYDETGRKHPDDWENFPIVGAPGATLANPWNDFVDRVAVRNGCEIKFWAHPHASHPLYSDKNVEITAWLKDGESTVPNHKAGTLRGWSFGMSASAYECRCSNKADVCDPASGCRISSSILANLYKD